MFAVLLILIAALAGAVIFNKKLHETLPPAVFFVTLTVYVLGLVLPLNIAVWSCLAVVTILLIIPVAMKTARDGMHLHKWIVFRPPYIIFIVVCLLFCLLLSNRMVFYYDDLSYWGIYTKNIFSINKLPHLFENCSVDYKDYTPIIQIFQYTALFGRRVFSEPVMFQANVCLIYVLLLPVLSRIEDRESPLSVRIITGVLYVIFPHILTAQFYYRLGVDLFLALTFGYAVIYIFDIERRRSEIFRMTVIALALAFLALIKSSGIVLCIFAVIMFLIMELLSEKKSVALLKTAVLLIFSLGSYLSWQMFLRYSWNNGYLSNRVKDGIRGGGLVFPEYTKEVVINYIKHFITYPLTRNKVGVTAAVLVVFIILCFVILKRSRERKALFISSMICLALFATAHLCMYLFVFDEWEAHGLLEFDRYITQYLGGIFMVYCCMLVRDAEGAGSGKTLKVLTYVSIMIFVMLLPYADMKYLIPSGYKAMTDKYVQMSENAKKEWDESQIADLGLAHDGTARLTVVADAWDETIQFIEYTAVPQPIDIFINVPAVDPGDINSFIENHLEAYVYVAKNAVNAYEGDWEETAELTDDGQALVSGGLYRVERSNDTKTLVRIR
ncbi:MAG: hypothetical protein J5367_05595 [Lachnospiraceae bacterium]|nr:hypothetical protein [Lachnospiraceae bacterium]